MRLLPAVLLFPLLLLSGACRSDGSRASPVAATSHLANNTVLIVRHAEKPDDGSGLTDAGEARARSYATYFEPFRQDGYNFRVDALYASADSSRSQRPRLTVGPLSRATGLPIDTSVSNKDAPSLVVLLQTQPHGTHPLVAWHHGQVPTLLRAFGADPAALLPGGVWPADVFDWVLLLRFDGSGKLVEAKRLVQPPVSSAP